MRESKHRWWLIPVLALTFFACETPTATLVSGVQGRVFANAGPGFFEYQATCTIIVSNNAGRALGEFPTDTLGAFRIPLSPGVYYLDVKESPDTAQSGPYKVPIWGYAEAQAYMYNSMIL
jgi:hypothetical protein